MSNSENKKKILVFIERPEAPAFMPRMRYVCAYLAANGYTIDLVAENSDGLKLFSDKINVYGIDHIKRQGTAGTIEWAAKYLMTLLFEYKDRYFYKKSKPVWKDKEYAAVLCSSCYTFPLTTAAKVAKNKNIPFFADLRDIAEQAADDFYILSHKPPRLFGRQLASLHRKINLKRRNKALKQACAVTSVSPWHVETLKKYNPNTILVYNGFDENFFYPEQAKTDKFQLSYFGRIYNDSLRNPRLLFEALQQLFKNGLIKADDVVVRWFTDEQSKQVIADYAGNFGLSDNMEYHSFIPPSQLRTELAASSVALVINADDGGKKYKGIMTTKFFEAVGVNRPVLCFPNNRDTLSELITESGCGLSSSDANEISSFILEKYQEWKNTGETLGTVSEQVRMNFARAVGAKKIMSALEKALT